jgi:hypothetical protein
MNQADRRVEQAGGEAFVMNAWSFFNRWKQRHRTAIRSGKEPKSDSMKYGAWNRVAHQPFPVCNRRDGARSSYR